MSRLYECDSGKVYYMPERHCVFCKHCETIWYDYTNGPYMFGCEFNTEDECLDYDSCGRFEDNGYVFDEKEYMDRLSKLIIAKKQEQDFSEMYPEVSNKIYEIMLRYLKGET